VLDGTVRWWKEEKGYGRINGDDGYVYFCHFSFVVPDTTGYRSLHQGQRVQFEWNGRVGANGRKAAENVRPL
jgi:CspA family cold shock protein